MQKNKTYKNVRFSTDALKEAHKKLSEFAVENELEINCVILSVEHDESEWGYDTQDEFFSDYRKYKNDAAYRHWCTDVSVHVNVRSSYTNIEVSSKDRAFIYSVFEVFEKYAPLDYVAPPPKSEKKPTVFIGHGGSNQWRDLKDHLQDKHHIKIEAYETGARAGHTIRDILEDMVNNSTFALLVMTAEDELDSGQMRARQNVIHEIGLFQGKLGFNRAIVLMEKSTEEFSNIAGIQQIRYDNITETFGEVLATIKREFN
jgi:predicted nucleotide-binding protein